MHAATHSDDQVGELHYIARTFYSRLGPSLPSYYPLVTCSSHSFSTHCPLNQVRMFHYMPPEWSSSVRLVVVLREPVAHDLSLYNHLKHDWFNHPTDEQVWVMEG